MGRVWIPGGVEQETGQPTHRGSRMSPMNFVRTIAALIFALAFVCQPAMASALSPASPGSRVWAFEDVQVVFTGGLGDASRGLHKGIGEAYDEIASGYRFAAGGAPKATVPYKRPSGATTPAQRASVQGKPCVDRGAVTPKQVADHKTPLVKEHYETGTIDTTQMRSVDAVQPQCPTCSARQGAEMSRYSREQRKLLEGE